MASVTFYSSYVSNTNADLKAGATVTASLYHAGGTLPPAESTIQSAYVTFGNIKVYISSAGFSTSYGNLSLSESQSGGSQTCALNNPSSMLLSFTGGSITFAVTRGASGTGNVLNVRSDSAITLVINYVASTCSTGSLNKTAVAQGASIAMTINPASGSYSHAVLWYRDGSHYYQQSCAAGVTSASYTIPASWPTGSASATLITYFEGSEVGRIAYSFTILIDPSTVVPTAGNLAVSLVQSTYIPSAWGVFVKGFSRALLTLSGSSPGSGASYQSVALACGSQSQSTASTMSFTTTVLLETGNVSCRATVTNNYSNSASATSRTITVYDYYAPIFVSASAFRCLQDGTPSDHGQYFGVTASVSIADVNGNNSLIALQAQYGINNSWSTAQTITNGELTIIGGAATQTDVYSIKITAIDVVQNNQNTSSTVIVTALTSEHVIFCKDGGLNVSFGMEGTRNNAVEINPNWDLWHGEEKLSGVTPVTRGGTEADNAADGLANLISALEYASTITWANDRLPLYRQSEGVTKYLTLYSLRYLLGFTTSTILNLANGGTGASDAATARTNLGITPANIGAAAASHNHAASAINSGTLNEARLPFKIRYGQTTVTGVSWQSVSFSGFSSTPAIVVSYAGNAATSGMSSQAVLKTSDESSTGFQVCMAGSSGSGSRTVNWIAIGT